MRAGPGRSSSRTLLAIALLVGLVALTSSGVLATTQAGGVPTAAASHLPRHTYARLLVVGDSISAGWFATQPAASYPAQLAALLRAHDRRDALALRVVAVAGTRAFEGLAELRRLATVPQSDLIVVEFGTNDYGRRPAIGRADFTSSYRALLALLAAASPGATFACLSVWGPPDRANSVGLTAADYNAIIARSCATLPPGHASVYVDITSLYDVGALHGPEGTRTSLGRADTFHPNDAGHRAIAAAIVAALP